MENSIEAFLEFGDVKVLPSGCWEWGGNQNGQGYGAIWDRTLSKRFLAHRESYSLHFGPIPEGLVIHHNCNNKLCVNPEHLQAMSMSEHTAMHCGKFHAEKTHCPHGHEYTEENTYNLPSGGRACRICHRERGRSEPKSKRVNANSLKTHCSQGHEYTEENTLVCHGVRHCRQCNREKARIRAAKNLELGINRKKANPTPFGQHQRMKTHCPKGHEYTSENTAIYRTSRYCKACRRKSEQQ